MPKCTDEKLDFGRVGRRVVEADFSGGDLSSEGGALLRERPVVPPCRGAVGFYGGLISSVGSPVS